jgi:hypothetical protein
MHIGCDSGCADVAGWHKRKISHWLTNVLFRVGNTGRLVAAARGIVRFRWRSRERHAENKNTQSADVKSLELLPAWPMALAPNWGAIGGLLVCLLFKSGLLKGSLFLDLTSSTQPDLTNPEVFKVMVWAFVAGFSEKLVPDTLDWLASNAVPESSVRANLSVPNPDAGLNDVHSGVKSKRLKHNEQAG